MSQVAGILAIVPDVVAQNFRSHSMNCFLGEQREWFRDSKWRDTGILWQIEIVHGEDLRRRKVVNMLLRIKIICRKNLGTWGLNERLEGWLHGL